MTPDRYVSLRTQAEAARERAAAVRAAFSVLREETSQILQSSRELRRSCREARLECRAANVQSALGRRVRTPRHPEAPKIARELALTLNNLGIPSFVYEPAEDTAIRL